MNDGTAGSQPTVTALKDLQVRPTRLSLPPKGSCWYCEKPVDDVRRFCNKNCTCSFDEEAKYTREER
jgi:hypothetical protein